MLIKFVKVVGAGNDFVLIDRERQALPRNLSILAKAVCKQHQSVGADGVVIIERTGDDRFRITCLNPDGSEATMCGNAVRCCAYYAMHHSGIMTPSLDICGQVLRARPNDDMIAVTFPPPHSLSGPSRIADYETYLVNTGTEHAVTFVTSLAAEDVQRIGSRIRYDPALSPRGANVNFAQIDGPSSVRVRTYERGVEAETLSCGSGAVACAVIGRHLNEFSHDLVTVANESGSSLQVSLSGARFPFHDIWLSGSAEIVYQGELEWHD